MKHEREESFDESGSVPTTPTKKRETSKKHDSPKKRDTSKKALGSELATPAGAWTNENRALFLEILFTEGVKGLDLNAVAKQVRTLST